MIQPWRRVERRNRKISSCRPRTGCSFPIGWSHSLSWATSGVIFGVFFVFSPTISGRFSLVETFWKLYVWLKIDFCFIGSPAVEPICRTAGGSTRRCRSPCTEAGWKRRRWKTWQKEEDQEKEDTESWIPSDWLALSWLMDLSWSYSPTPKNGYMGCYGYNCINPQRIWGLSEHIWTWFLSWAHWETFEP